MRTAVLRGDGVPEYTVQLEARGERDGLRVFAVRDCRVPFKGLLEAQLQRKAADAPPAPPAEGEGAPEGRAAPAESAPDTKGLVLMEATASSTGVDHHGTEMTRKALDSMARQMKASVVFVPSHWRAEWDEVMGETVDAEVVEGKVARDGATGKPGKGFHLRVVVGLYEDHEDAQALVRAVQRGRPAVGTSIGGWFTDMEFLFNEDDEVERVLIHDVELDHLASTRRPSNRESWVEGLRTQARAAMLELRSAEAAPAAPAAAQVPDAAPVPVAVRSQPEPDAPSPATRAACACDVAGCCGPDCACGCSCDGETRAEGCACGGERTSEPPDHQPAESPEPTVLDAPAAPVDTAADTSSTDGDAGVRNLPPSPGDPAMPTAEERIASLEALLGRTAAAVEQLAARTVAPVPASPVAETDLERANRENVELRSRLERTMTAAGRAGTAGITRQRIEASGGFKGLVARTAPRLPATSALRMVCEAQAERRDQPVILDRASLENDLRSMLFAAFADGVISDPYEAADAVD